MTDAPATLARPLAARVMGLPEAYPPVQPLQPQSEAVLDAAADALDAGKTHYTDRPGILPLRERISAMLKASGLPIEPNAITITCGVEEARFVALKQLAQPGQNIFTSSESFRDVEGAAHLLGLCLLDSPPGTPQIAYISNPKDAPELAAFNPAWLLVVIGDSSEIPEGLPLDKTVFIGEFHTMPGWRVGFMAGSSAHNKLRAYKQSMTICTPSVSQWAALGLFDREGK